MLVVMLPMVFWFLRDFIEISLVLVPIIEPALLTMGLNPIWFGVMPPLIYEPRF